MTKQMALSVLVKLVDRLTGPLSRMMALINRLTSGAGTRFAALGTHIANLTGRIGNLARQIGTMGGVIGLLTFAAPVKAAADIDAAVRDIGITADLSGAQIESFVTHTIADFERLALQTGQLSSKIAGAAGLLVQAGMPEGMIDKFLPTIARVATAEKAEILDIAKMSFTLWKNLGIGPEQLELALARLVRAGKLGRFELRNMAKEFPEWAVKIAPYLKGQEAVSTLGALGQIAMFGTDSPDEASTSLSNFFTHLLSKETLEHFKEKFQTDIVGVMNSAKIYGINPIEAALQRIVKVTGITSKEVKKIYDSARAKGATRKAALDEVEADLKQLVAAQKLTELFPDIRVLRFLGSFLIHKQDYVDIKKKIEAEMGEVIGQDFASRMASLELQLLRFQELGTQAMRRVGFAFATNLGVINDAIKALLINLNELDKRSPGLADSLLGWGGAAVLGVAALGLLGQAIRYIGAGLFFLLAPLKLLRPLMGLAWASASFLARGMAALGFGVARLFTPLGLMQLGILAWWAKTRLIIPVLSRLLSLVGFLGRALIFVAGVIAAFVSAPVWLVVAGIAALAAGAALLYAYWEPVSAFFSDLWEGVKAAFDGFVSWLVDWTGGALSSAIRGIADAWKNLIPDWVKRAALAASLAAVPGGAAIGAGMSLANAGAAAGFAPWTSEQKVGGQIVVTVEGPGAVKNVQSDNPAVPIVADRGAMVGRP